MNSKDDTINDLLQPRGRHSGIVKGDSRRTETEDAVSDDYIAFARGRIGKRPQMMLAFQKCTGETFAVAYSLLTRIKSDNPDRGFSMTFGDSDIKIEGEKLTQLFHYVCEHRALEIVEADRTTIMTLNGFTFVSRIQLNRASLNSG